MGGLQLVLNKKNRIGDNRVDGPIFNALSNFTKLWYMCDLGVDFQRFGN
jgi:hypothetical protein